MKIDFNKSKDGLVPAIIQDKKTLLIKSKSDLKGYKNENCSILLFRKTRRSYRLY